MSASQLAGVPPLSAGLLDARTTIHSILLVSLLIFTGISVTLFVRNRDVYPVKARAPFISSFAILFSVEFLALVNMVATITSFQIQCVTWGILSYSVGINGYFLAISAKIFSIILRHQAELKKIEIATKLKKLAVFVPESFSKSNIVLKLTSNSRILFPMLGALMFFIINIPLFVALGKYGEGLSLDPGYYGAACFGFSNILGDASFAFGIIFFIGLVATSRLLAQVEDNHFLKLEIKRIVLFFLALITIYILVRFVPGVDTNSINSISYAVILETELPAFVMVYVCFLDIALRASRSGTKNIALSKISHTNYEAIESSREPSRAHPSTKKLMNSTEEMEQLLENPQKLEAFRQFLQKEFCVEGLLFLEHVYFFKKNCPTLSSADRTGVAFAVYSMFIGEDSPLNVNISGKQREVLKSAFTNQGANEISEDVFDKAYLEVINLLAIDSFQRFKTKLETEDGN
jgi:hypothetical protein